MRGGVRIIKTLGVWDSFDEINFDLLPDKFVLKTTHDSGTIVICDNKRILDKASAKKQLEEKEISICTVENGHIKMCGQGYLLKNIW